MSMDIRDFLDRLEGVVKGSKINQWTARCPSHDDKQNSLSISYDKDKILLRCFAGKCDYKDIVKSMGLELKDICTNTPKQKEYKEPTIRIQDLAIKKGLTVEDLTKHGVKQAHSYIFIPYHNIDGTQAIKNRLRIDLVAKNGSRWTKGDGEIVPYGLERLKQENLILVEGESDSWTLWKYGFNVLGIPSIEMTKCLKKSMIEKINIIYVVQENDKAGEKFVKNIKERFQEKEIRIISLPKEYKDPNQMYMANPDIFEEKFNELILQAKKVTKKHIESNGQLLKTIHGEDVDFYVYSNGIFAEREVKDKETGKSHRYVNKVCSTPLIIESLIEDMYSEESYVKLVWGNKSKLVPTHWLYVKNMQNLTRIGIKVLSKNAKLLSEYALESLEFAEVLKTSTRNGWKDNNIVIGNSLISVDGVGKMERNKDSVIVGSNGSFDKWKEAVEPFFDDPQVQLIAGCSTVSLLLEVLSLPSFTLHIYGESSKGKTLTSQIAASIWGNPHTMLKDWRGTSVSHELYFHKMKNLPCFLEECQENRIEIIKETLYQFGNNVGKTRGTIKDGQIDLAEGKDWRTTMLSTGEVRVTDSTIQGGMFARVLEIKKKLYKKYDDDLLFIRIDRAFGEHYGHGGVKIAQYVLENKEKLISTYDYMYKQLRPKLENAIAGSDIKRRVVKHIVAIMLGASINHEVLGLQFDKKAVFKELEELMTNMPETSITERLHSFMTDFFVQNVEHFVQKTGGLFIEKENPKDIYGFSYDDEGIIYFIQKPLKDAMTKAGFSWSMLQSLQDADLLEHNANRITKSIKTMDIASLLPLNKNNKPTMSLRCIGLKVSKPEVINDDASLSYD